MEIVCFGISINYVDYFSSFVGFLGVYVSLYSSFSVVNLVRSGGGSGFFLN